MVFQFDTLKAAQAAAILLKQEGGRMSRLRLLKLLYIADRESMAQTTRPITGDDIVAMDHGPVLSQTYDLIKRKAGKEGEIWDRYIELRGDREHVLVNEPGEGCLSDFEIAKLRAVSNMRRGMTDYEIADETHRFPEWIKNQPPEGGRQDIPLHDVLDALGMAAYEEKLLDEEQDENDFTTALEQVRGQ